MHLELNAPNAISFFQHFSHNKNMKLLLMVHTKYFLIHVLLVFSD